MVRPIDKLTGLINKKKNVPDANVGLLMSELGACDAMLGADYEVTDANGKLIARIRRKPLSYEQVGELMKILEEVVKVKNPKRR